MSRTDTADRTGSSRGLSRAGLCWAAIWLTFAGVCLAGAAPEGFWSSLFGDGAPAASAPAPPAPTYRTKPIEEIRVGERVLSGNPELSDAEGAAVPKADRATRRAASPESRRAAKRPDPRARAPRLRQHRR